MASKWKFIDIDGYLKKVAFLIKTALVKTFIYKHFNKLFSKANFKNSFINNITSSYTKTINNLFIAVIITSCISAITYSYYEQKRKFELSLLNQSKVLSFQIENLINNYKSSMEAIANVLLADNLLSKEDNVLQILKLSFTEDEHLKLLPITFYSTIKPYNSFNAYGIAGGDPPDLGFINKLEQKSDKFIFYDHHDKKAKQNLTLNLPLYKAQNNSNKPTQLLGYLSLPITIQTILENIHDNASNKNLLKIIRQDKIQYLIKQENKYRFSSTAPEYQFADAVNISNTPYLVAVGSNKEAILENTLRSSVERCSIILTISIIMLFIYNFFERKKIRKQCSKLFTEEVSLLNQKIEELNLQNQQDNNQNKKLIRLNNAIKTISNIEANIKQERDKTIDIIQDSLNLKGHKNNEDLTIDLIQHSFQKIYKLCEDLKHNVVSRDESSEIDLTQLISEIIPIFSSITDERRITFINKVKNITLKTNDLILKQVLISLIARALYFIPEEGEMIISANKDTNRNLVSIEIKDNGISLDEALFRNVPKNNSFFEMANIQLDSNTIENLIKQRFKGNIQIDSDREGNHISILLPIELNEDSKVVPMPIIGARR